MIPGWAAMLWAFLGALIAWHYPELYYFPNNWL